MDSKSIRKASRSLNKLVNGALQLGEALAEEKALSQALGQRVVQLTAEGEALRAAFLQKQHGEGALAGEIEDLRATISSLNRQLDEQPDPVVVHAPVTAHGMPLVDLAAFRESGLLQEINRLVLHPIGYSLEPVIEGAKLGMTDQQIGMLPALSATTFPMQLIDATSDLDGVIAADPQAKLDERAEHVAVLWRTRAEVRGARVGFSCQPVPGSNERLVVRAEIGPVTSPGQR